MTLNLSGVADVSVGALLNLSPQSPKTPTPAISSNGGNCNSSAAALITFNTPPASPVFDLSANNNGTDGNASDSLLNNNVTVTHFSEQRGGVVEKISVPSLNIYSAEMSSPKLDNKTRAQHNVIQASSVNSHSKNPFINTPSPTVLLTATTPTANTNPFMENNNGPMLLSNGKGGGEVDPSDATLNNLDVGANKLEKIILDKNPFRDREVVAAANKLNVDNNNGNKEEIVTVSEIDGGRMAEIIKVRMGERERRFAFDSFLICFKCAFV